MSQGNSKKNSHGKKSLSVTVTPSQGFVGLILQSAGCRALSVNTTDKLNYVSHFLNKTMIFFCSFLAKTATCLADFINKALY